MEKLAVLRWTIRTRDGGSRLNSFGKFYYVAANRQGISMVYMSTKTDTHIILSSMTYKSSLLIYQNPVLKLKKKQKTKRDCAQPFFYLLFEHRANDFVLLQSLQQQLEFCPLFLCRQSY